MTKVYAVEFMRYTNGLKDTVSDGTPLPDTEYLKIGSETFLVQEDQLEKYLRFGGGFRNIKFVGNLE